MLFPENPENRPALWDSVARQLAQEAVCFIVDRGVGNIESTATRLRHDAVLGAIDRLRKSSICRISANRGRAICPHFAGERENGDVFITDFITVPLGGSTTPEVSQLRNDMESAVISLLYGGEDASSVYIPLSIEPWAMKDVEVRKTKRGLIFTKK